MFIELTDHLICPAGHEEQYLVLLPGEMDGRRVVTGDLGCPVCDRVVRVRDGIAAFDGAPGPADTPTALTGDAVTAEAAAAFLGLHGPGGFVALAGSVGGLAPELHALLPGIALALVNPPAGTTDTLEASVLRAARLVLKRSSMRGVVVGPEFAPQPDWIADAIRATLPGLRIVALGGEPPETVQVLGRTAGCWVGQKPTTRPTG